VRDIGPLSSSEASGAGDLATAESLPDHRERTRASGDGRWWWDGRRWLSTTTDDGLWRWDRTGWQPTIEMAGMRPWDLTTTLTLLAEDRYARAALILVQRAREWGPEGEPRHLVEQATRLRQRRLRPDRALAGPDGAPDLLWLVRRLRARPDDRHRLDADRALLDDQHRAVLVRLGRAAPCPTVEEADELLEVARRLDARSVALGAALAAVDRAELARSRAVGAAQRALEQAEERRRDALAAGRLALEDAQGRREEARCEARDRLRRALVPPSGPALAQVGPLRACPMAVETPAGRLSLGGLKARVDTAAALWAQRRERLQDLLLLDTSEGEAFAHALTGQPDDQFVLLEGRTRAVLWPCPAGQEEAAHAFAGAVRRLARRAARRAAEREAAVREAVEGAAAAAAAAAVPREERAREALERLEADPDLLRPIADARERQARAREDPPDLLAARRQVAEIVQLLTTPPAPLG
jgi:hypothetical protein